MKFNWKGVGWQTQPCCKVQVKVNTISENESFPPVVKLNIVFSPETFSKCINYKDNLNINLKKLSNSAKIQHLNMDFSSCSYEVHIKSKRILILDLWWLKLSWIISVNKHTAHLHVSLSSSRNRNPLWIPARLSALFLSQNGDGLCHTSPFICCVLNVDCALRGEPSGAMPVQQHVCVIPKQRSLRRRQNISIKMYQTVSRLFSISRCCLCGAWRGMLKWF